MCGFLGLAGGAPADACAAAVNHNAFASKRATDNAAGSHGCLRIRIAGTPSHWLTTPVQPVPLGHYSDHTSRPA